MEASDLEVLLAAQGKAMRILSEARTSAEARLRGGQAEAARLLLQQQAAAESLLSKQHSEAVDKFRRVEKAASEEPEDQRQGMLSAARTEADALLEIQWIAAEALRSKEAEAAAETQDAAERAVVEQLRNAQREAAAVLLEARMLIDDRRRAQSAAKGS